MKGAVLTPRPSGKLVGAEDLTERADCHLIHTPELRQVSGCGEKEIHRWIEYKRHYNYQERAVI